MKRLFILMFVFLLVTMAVGMAVALGPNFNQNAGRRLARYAIQNEYTLNQIQNASAQNVINLLSITDPNTQAAIVSGWDEIQAETIRMWKINNPTPAEVTIAGIRALIRELFPNFTITKVAGKDDQYVIDLDGIE